MGCTHSVSDNDQIYSTYGYPLVAPAFSTNCETNTFITRHSTYGVTLPVPVLNANSFYFTRRP